MHRLLGNSRHNFCDGCKKYGVGRVFFLKGWGGVGVGHGAPKIRENKSKNGFHVDVGVLDMRPKPPYL